MLLISASREHLKREVWNKGESIVGADAGQWRKDSHGWIIHFADHGNHTSPYGWEMRHVVSRSRGGSDQAFNLQPLNVSRLREGQNPHPWRRHR